MRSWLLIRALLTGLLLTGVLQACAAESAGTEHLIVLRSGDLEVGILADFGGKLVWVSKAGSANFLRENRAHWLPAAWPESVHVNFRRAAFYGTTHWLAPQEHWWQQQDLIPERQGDDWPPDPFLEFGRYQILERTTSAVTIISPPSPVSGVQMKKTFQ
ncbi:MAG: DUF4380 domain-containing protein [Verrucomicrobia bacterium]|nr:DUF4380 domain-containing protein [Verrucomicrobiota bacterium]